MLSHRHIIAAAAVFLQLSACAAVGDYLNGPSGPNPEELEARGKSVFEIVNQTAKPVDALYSSVCEWDTWRVLMNSTLLLRPVVAPGDTYSLEMYRGECYDFKVVFSDGSELVRRNVVFPPEGVLWTLSAD